MIRKKYSADFKAKVALEATKGLKTTSEIASEYGVHGNQIAKWKKQLISNMSDIFSGKSEKREQNTEQALGELYKEIGKLKVENDFLKKTVYQI